LASFQDGGKASPRLAVVIGKKFYSGIGALNMKILMPAYALELIFGRTKNCDRPSTCAAGAGE
jgi:hypothetical protein